MGVFRGRKVVPARTPAELDAMAAAGAVVARALAAVAEAVRPGVSTAQLDTVAAAVIADAGAVPSFLGYHGFTGTICSSINDRVVHGIPSAAEIVGDGDLVSIDCGAILDGWHGDAAVTVTVGQTTQADRELSAACRAAMSAGIAAMVVGNRLGDVSHAIEVEAEAAAGRDGRRYGMVDGYGGHGIGRVMHADPFLANEGPPNTGPRLVEGSVLAIEPMLTLGTVDTRVLDDDWTVVTTDGSRAAHWEHTVAVTASGPRILTVAS